MKLAFYITGHGFGHATRAVSVMKALIQRFPGIHLYIRTLAPEQIFYALGEGDYEFEPVQLDTGGFERNVLFTDVERTVSVAQKFYENTEPIIASEVDFLKKNSIDTVLFDVPPMAAEIAHRAGIPSIACTNFSWDVIYEDYPGAESLVELFRQWHSKTTLALEIPLGHSLTSFPRRERIPIIARQSQANRREVREQLGVHDDQIVVLTAFRGAELHGNPLECLDERILFLGFGELPGKSVHLLDEQWQFRFPDLVLAADVVLSKPGYGIVSECIANQSAFLHLPREGFAETAPMLADMQGLLPFASIELDELNSHVLQEKIHQLAEPPFQWPNTPLNGADVAAEMVGEVFRKK